MTKVLHRAWISAPQEEVRLAAAVHKPGVDPQAAPGAGGEDHEQDAQDHEIAPGPVVPEGGQEGVQDEEARGQAGERGEKADQQEQADQEFGDQLEGGENSARGEDEVFYEGRKPGERIG